MTFDQLVGKVRTKHPAVAEREAMEIVYATIEQLGVKVDEASGELVGVAIVRESPFEPENQGAKDAGRYNSMARARRRR